MPILRYFAGKRQLLEIEVSTPVKWKEAIIIRYHHNTHTHKVESCPDEGIYTHTTPLTQTRVMPGKRT